MPPPDPPPDQGIDISTPFNAAGFGAYQQTPTPKPAARDVVSYMTDTVLGMAQGVASIPAGIAGAVSRTPEKLVSPDQQKTARDAQDFWSDTNYWLEQAKSKAGQAEDAAGGPDVTTDPVHAIFQGGTGIVAQAPLMMLGPFAPLAFGVQGVGEQANKIREEIRFADHSDLMKAPAYKQVWDQTHNEEQAREALYQATNDATTNLIAGGGSAIGGGLLSHLVPKSAIKFLPEALTNKMMAGQGWKGRLISGAAGGFGAGATMTGSAEYAEQQAKYEAGLGPKPDMGAIALHAAKSGLTLAPITGATHLAWGKKPTIVKPAADIGADTAAVAGSMARNNFAITDPYDRAPGARPTAGAPDTTAPTPAGQPHEPLGGAHMPSGGAEMPPGYADYEQGVPQPGPQPGAPGGPLEPLPASPERPYLPPGAPEPGRPAYMPPGTPEEAAYQPSEYGPGMGPAIGRPAPRPPPRVGGRVMRAEDIAGRSGYEPSEYGTEVTPQASPTRGGAFGSRLARAEELRRARRTEMQPSDLYGSESEYGPETPPTTPSPTGGGGGFGSRFARQEELRRARGTRMQSGDLHGEYGPDIEAPGDVIQAGREMLPTDIYEPGSIEHGRARASEMLDQLETLKRRRERMETTGKKRGAAKLDDQISELRRKLIAHNRALKAGRVPEEEAPSLPSGGAAESAHTAAQRAAETAWHTRIYHAMDALPPVRKGHKRLFRIEPVRHLDGRPLSGPADQPDWLREAAERSGNTDAGGRWFADHPAELAWYARHATENGYEVALRHVDVPEHEAERHRVSNLPDDHSTRGFSRRPEHEFFVPREVADRSERSDIPEEPPPSNVVGLHPPDLDPRLAEHTTPELREALAEARAQEQQSSDEFARARDRHDVDGMHHHGDVAEHYGGVGDALEMELEERERHPAAAERRRQEILAEREAKQQAEHEAARERGDRTGDSIFGVKGSDLLSDLGVEPHRAGRGGEERALPETANQPGRGTLRGTAAQLERATARAKERQEAKVEKTKIRGEPTAEQEPDQGGRKGRLIIRKAEERAAARKRIETEAEKGEGEAVKVRSERVPSMEARTERERREAAMKEAQERRRVAAEREAGTNEAMRKILETMAGTEAQRQGERLRQLRLGRRMARKFKNIASYTGELLLENIAKMRGQRVDRTPILERMAAKADAVRTRVKDRQRRRDERNRHYEIREGYAKKALLGDETNLSIPDLTRLAVEGYTQKFAEGEWGMFEPRGKRGEKLLRQGVDPETLPLRKQLDLFTQAIDKTPHEHLRNVAQQIRDDVQSRIEAGAEAYKQMREYLAAIGETPRIRLGINDRRGRGDWHRQFAALRQFNSAVDGIIKPGGSFDTAHTPKQREDAYYRLRSLITSHYEREMALRTGGIKQMDKADRAGLKAAKAQIESSLLTGRKAGRLSARERFHAQQAEAIIDRALAADAESEAVQPERYGRDTEPEIASSAEEEAFRHTYEDMPNIMYRVQQALDVLLPRYGHQVVRDAQRKVVEDWLDEFQRRMNINIERTSPDRPRTVQEYLDSVGDQAERNRLMTQRFGVQFHAMAPEYKQMSIDYGTLITPVDVLDTLSSRRIWERRQADLQARSGQPVTYQDIAGQEQTALNQHRALSAGDLYLPFGEQLEFLRRLNGGAEEPTETDLALRGQQLVDKAGRLHDALQSFDPALWSDPKWNWTSENLQKVHRDSRERAGETPEDPADVTPELVQSDFRRWESDLQDVENEARFHYERMNPDARHMEYGVGNVLDSAADLRRTGELPAGAYVTKVSDYTRGAFEPTGQSPYAARSGNETVRHFLNTAHDLVGDLDVVHLTDEQMNMAAQERGLPADTPSFYDRPTDRIIVRQSAMQGAERNRLLIHELAHPIMEAATQDPKMAPVVKRLDEHRALLEKAFLDDSHPQHADVVRLLDGNAQGLDNVHEFFSELWSNPDFAKALNVIPTTAAQRARWMTGKRETLLAAVLQDIKRGLTGMFFNVSKNRLLNDSTVAGLDLLNRMQERGRGRPIFRDEEGEPLARPATARQVGGSLPGRPSEGFVKDVWQGLTERGKDIAAHVNQEGGMTGMVLKVMNFADLARTAEARRPGQEVMQDHVYRIHNVAEEAHQRKKEIMEKEDHQHWRALATELRVKSPGHVEAIVDYMDRANYVGATGYDRLGEGTNKWVGSRDEPGNRQTHNEWGALNRMWNALPESSQKMIKGLETYYKGRYDAVRDATLRDLVHLRGFVEGQHDGASKALMKHITDGRESLTPEETALLKQHVRGYDGYDKPEKERSKDNKEFRDYLGQMRALPEFKKIAGVYYPMMRRGNYVVEAFAKLDRFAQPFGGVEQNREPGERPTGNWDFPSKEAANQFVDRMAQDDAPFLKIQKAYETADGKWRVDVNPMHLNFHASLRKAQEEHARLSNDPDMDVLNLQARQDLGNYAMNPTWATKLMKDMIESTKRTAAYRGLDETTQQIMSREWNEMAVRHLMSTSARSRYLPREYTSGASKDALDNLMQYSNNTANTLADLEFRPRMRDAVAAMDKYERDMRDSKDPEISKYGLRRSQVKNEVHNRLRARNDHLGSSIVTKAMQGILKLSFLDKLMSPGFLLLNASEPWTIAAPMLAGEHGMKAYGEMAKAYSILGAGRVWGAGAADFMKVVKEGIHGDPQLADTLKLLTDKIRETGFSDKWSTTQELIEMLQYLQKHGYLDRNAGMELAQALDPRAGVIGRGLNWVDNMFRQGNVAVENVNRGVAGIAGYRLAKMKGKSHEEAMRAAQDIVDKSAGNYGFINAPKIFNHPALKFAAQFKKYALRMTSNLIRVFAGAIRGEPGAMGQMVAMLASQQVISGALGMPTEPLKAMITVTNQLGLNPYNTDDVERILNERLAGVLGRQGKDAFLYGLPRLLGTGFGARTGWDTLWTYGTLGNKRDDLAIALGHLAGGAPGGLLAEWLQGIHDASAGVSSYMHGAHTQGNESMVNAFRLLVPVKVIADALPALQDYFTGRQKPSGQPFDFKPTIGDTIQRIGGIRTSRDLAASQARGAFIRQRDVYNADRTRTLQGYAQASNSAERAAIRDNIIHRWNADKPAVQRITYGDLQKAATAFERKGKLNPGDLGLAITKRTRPFAPNPDVYGFMPSGS